MNQTAPRTRQNEIYNVEKYNPTAQHEVTIIPNNQRYVWRTARWTNCSQECGEGGKRSRRVHCTNNQTKNQEVIDDNYCDPALKPVATNDCNHFRCPEWNFGAYSEVGLTQIFCWGSNGFKFYYFFSVDMIVSIIVKYFVVIIGDKSMIQNVQQMKDLPVKENVVISNGELDGHR